MAAFQGIIDGLSLMAGISEAVSELQNSQPSWDSGLSFAKRLQEVKKDLIYLEKELEPAKKGIEQLQLMVRSLIPKAATYLLFPAQLLITQADTRPSQIETRPSQIETRPSSLRSNNCGYLFYSIHLLFGRWKMSRRQRLVGLILIGSFGNKLPKKCSAHGLL